jgi:hypothetical protein
MTDLLFRPTFHGFVAAVIIGIGFTVLLRLMRDRAALWPVLYAFLFVAMSGSYVLGFGHNSWVQTFTAEDRQVEWATFWLAMLAAACAAAAAWRARPRTAGLLAVGLVVLSVVLAGEEIAWGQRKLGLELPALFAEHNVQGEITIHNLAVFGVPLTRWLQASAPLAILLSFFAWQYAFRTTAERYAGFRFNPRVTAFSLTFAMFFFLSNYHFPLKVVEDIPLARIPVEMFRRRASTQSELSEMMFAALLLLAGLSLWRRFADGRDIFWSVKPAGGLRSFKSAS